MLMKEFNGLGVDGREAFELIYGSDAASSLKAAMNNGSIEEIDAVARTYVGTQDGGKAALLAARFWLDRGKPGAAISVLEFLSECEWVAASFQPELALLQADAYLKLGTRQSAIEVINELRKVGTQEKVQISGEDVELPGNDEEIAYWLGQYLGDERKDQQDGCLDLAKLELIPAWSSNLMPTKQVESVVNRLATQMREKGHTTVAVPVVAESVIIAHGIDGIYGLDARGGKKIWRYPSTESFFDGELTAKTYQHRHTNGETSHEESESLNRKGRMLFQKIWLDEHFATLKEMGGRLFVLEGWKDGLRFINNANWIHGNFFHRIHNSRGTTNAPNRYVALGLAREGAIEWRSPAIAHDEETNEFLSSEICGFENHFAYLVRSRQELLLRICNQRNNEIVWEQPLLGESKNIWLDFRVFDRFKPVELKVRSDGKALVCVGVQLIFGLDLKERRISWVRALHDETKAGQSNQTQSHLAIFPRENRNYSLSSQRNKFREKIEESIENPVETIELLCNESFGVAKLSDRIECFDLDTGRQVWALSSLPDWNLEAIADRWLLISNGARVAKLSIMNGDRIWPEKVRLLPCLGHRIGKGSLHKNLYFMSISSDEIVALDMNDGSSRAFSISNPVGNLVYDSGLLVSQAPAALNAWNVAWQRSGGADALETNESAAESSVEDKGPAESVHDSTPEELVTLLGSNSFMRRQASGRALEALGKAAVPAVTAGLKSVDLEIQHRCRVLLGRINTTAIDGDIKAFLAGEHELPGWLQVKDVFGDSDVSREIYGLAYRTEYDLLQRYAKKTCDREKLATDLYKKASDTVARIQYEEQPPFGTAMTALILALDDEIRDHLNKNQNWHSHVTSLFRSNQATMSLRKEGQGVVIKDLFSKLVLKEPTSFALFQFANQWKLPARFASARALLETIKVNTNSQYWIQSVIGVIISDAKKSDIVLLERFSDDEMVIDENGDGRGRSFVLQLRDLSTFAIIKCNGKDPFEYGFVKHQHGRATLPFGFATDEDRQAAFAKWNAEKEKLDSADPSKSAESKQEGSKTPKRSNTDSKKLNSLDLDAINPFGCTNHGSGHGIAKPARASISQRLAAADSPNCHQNLRRQRRRL